MLKVCSNALLLSNVAKFSETYKQIALEFDVSLRIETEWKDSYRIKEAVVICGTKYFDCINKAYYPVTVLILKKGESFIPYAKKGVSRFIFDFEDKNELAFAFMKAEQIVLQSTSNELKNIIKENDITSFQQGDYQFFFDKNKYLYKDKALYLTEGQKKYLAEWLLNGNKDNKKRMTLFALRKKFGNDFMRDIDRFGQLKGKKNEKLQNIKTE